ncbi:cysteine proteinase 15A [Pelomyxa schiedti]|nr:cysteine proteinase 15A [Pelomyxa schiedti]
MNKILVLVLLVGAVAALSDFDSWVKQYGKVYHSLAEYKHRKTLWTAKLAEIERFNAEGHSWKKGINQFSDLTAEEFKANYLMAPRRSRAVGASGTNITQTIDWVAKGAVTSVKNQKECGSCWAFGTAESIEGCYQLAGYTLTSFSEQQLVDCVSGIKYHCSGCEGGLESGAMQWMIDNKVGLETEDDYPYTSVLKAGKCAEEAKKYVGYITSFKEIATEADLQAAAMVQPVDVGINAETLSDYSSGVWCPSVCDPKNIDHAVLVAGMTASTNSYTIKNSWGATWGESGYFRMCGGNNECGVGNEAVIPQGCYSA